MKFFLLTATFLFPFLAFAQITTGTVTYEETITLNINKDGETSKFAHLMPSSQTTDFVLRFTPEATHYTVVEEDTAPPPPPAEGESTFQIKIVRSGDNNAVYTDLNANEMIEQRSIFGRAFRIEHQLTGGDWKLSTEQKDILGYTCMKATTGADSTLVTAWFAPEIAVPVGPATYGQLPGLILEVEYDDIHVVATAVETTIDDPALIAPPKKGKVVTETEFDRLQEEKMKEMEARNGRVIRMNRG